MLTGCVSTTSYPADPNAAQLETERQRTLDLTWQNLNLSDEAPRPTPPVTPLAEGADWSATLFECLTSVDNTVNSFGYSGATGVDLRSGRDFDDQTLIGFYNCLAAMPIVPYAVSELRTPEQVDYFYNYYKSWLVPCLETHGFEVENIPSRSQFEEDGALWSPYQLIELNDLLETNDLVLDCGADPGNAQIMQTLDFLQATADEIEQDE